MFLIKTSVFLIVFLEKGVRRPAMRSTALEISKMMRQHICCQNQSRHHQPTSMLPMRLLTGSNVRIVRQHIWCRIILRSISCVHTRTRSNAATADVRMSGSMPSTCTKINASIDNNIRRNYLVVLNIISTIFSIKNFLYFFSYPNRFVFILLHHNIHPKHTRISLSRSSL